VPLFLVSTGLRSLDARTLRREHVDFAAGTLPRPRPKGGEDQAFTVPRIYNRPSIEHLRGCVEGMAGFLGARIEGEEE
jgi:integrase